MGRRKDCFLRRNYLWIAVTMQFVLFTTGANFTTVFPQATAETEDGYAWSAWGSWSPCSRSCGGGVSVQERQCLPRIGNLVANATSSAPVRATRQVTQDCVGVARRYLECNTTPCISGVADMRSEQCSSYDRRPFRGRFYTWVPYVDGDSPCMLNCRPLGQHFYASLSLVADGTPCTRPGYRAICVQGTCQIVGRESVLGVGHEAHCGRRLVSGLFTRPRLPLGYSYITTVPRGACRLNVSEIVSNDNYIALKISNGSYIMNGEFAVSAPGTYEAAGARFLYTRHAGQDVVFAHGPILHPIDIMVLYTQPGPSIKYEFFTKSLPGEIDEDSNSLPEDSTTKHIRRHHDRHLNFESLTKDLNKNRIEDTAPRKFMWKILSYSQCSRSCGGGIQIGKYRCVETSLSGDREVSSAHCTEPPPTTRRRRCGNTQCPPRWRTAAWSPCPQCGPATRTRIVGCVQDHNKGITKISDVKCPAPKPPTTEACNIPSCGTDVRLAGRTRDQTDTFRDGPVYTVALNSTDIDVGPEYSLSAGGWQYTDWSECVGWCIGGGVQSRSVRCADPAGCERRTCPVAARNCTPTVKCEAHEGHWFTGEWSPCTTTCNGKQVRGVLCIGDTGRHLRDAACRSSRPEHERSCGGECTPTWYTSDWGQCTGNCSSGTGLQRRSVVCARAEDSHEPRCTGQRPTDQRPCSLVCSVPTIPPDLTIESQKIATEITTTHRSISAEEHKSGCEDKLPNCALAVQARLCHYKYYIYNCCESCNIL